MPDPLHPAEGRVLGAQTVREFDTAAVVPMFGYETVMHYYQDASTAHRLGREMGVPFLALNAEDDPVCAVRGVPVEAVRENDNLFFAITDEGGHLAWCKGWWPTGASWVEAPTCDFLASVAQWERDHPRPIDPVHAVEVGDSPVETVRHVGDHERVAAIRRELERHAAVAASADTDGAGDDDNFDEEGFDINEEDSAGEGNELGGEEDEADVEDGNLATRRGLDSVPRATPSVGSRSPATPRGPPVATPSAVVVSPQQLFPHRVMSARRRGAPVARTNPHGNRTAHVDPETGTADDEGFGVADVGADDPEDRTRWTGEDDTRSSEASEGRVGSRRAKVAHGVGVGDGESHAARASDALREEWRERVGPPASSIVIGVAIAPGVGVSGPARAAPRTAPRFDGSRLPPLGASSLIVTHK